MINIKYVAFDVHKSIISAAVLNLEGKLVTRVRVAWKIFDSYLNVSLSMYTDN